MPNRAPRPPDGHTIESIRDYLSLAARRDDPRATREYEQYLDADLGRFLMTLDLVPDGEGRLLEIGADPFFMTLLLDAFRHYDLTLANGGATGTTEDFVLAPATREERVFTYSLVNIEEEGLPFDACSFDVILFCEVLEHLVADPMLALANVNRMLKVGGTLILTTPNAARAVNVAALANGQNIHDQYSAYGPYGRHNREYTIGELDNMLVKSGFDIGELYSADYDVRIAGVDRRKLGLRRRLFDRAVSAIPGRRASLGFTLFARATKVGPPSGGLPRWLYRSYPEGEFAD